MGYSYRTTQQSAGRVNGAGAAPSADAAQEVAQSATIRCPRCRTEQEIIFNYATLGGGLGACVGPANRKQPCAECGSPPDEPCQRVYQNTIALPASKNYSNTSPQHAEPTATECEHATINQVFAAEQAATDADYTSAASVAKVVAKLTDWNWLAEYANAGWNLPAASTDALAMVTGRAAAMLTALRDTVERQAREIAELKSERNAAQRAGVTTANYWMERAEMAEDQRERTRDVWATRAERAEAELHKANIDSANLLAECSDLSVDVEKYRQEIAALRLAVKDDAQWAQENERLTRELDRVKAQLTSEITAALADRDALRECVKAMDELRRYVLPKGKEGWEILSAYDAARAKVKP